MISTKSVKESKSQNGKEEYLRIRYCSATATTPRLKKNKQRKKSVQPTESQCSAPPYMRTLDVPSSETELIPALKHTRLDRRPVLDHRDRQVAPLGRH